MILRTFHIICRRCILSSIFLFLMLFVLGGIYVTKCYATYYNLYLTSGSLGVSKGNKGLSFNVPNSGGLILSSITKGNASGNPFPELLTKKGTIYVDDHDGTGVQNATAGGSEGISGDGSDKYESLIFTFPSPADAQQVSMAFNEDFKSPGVALWVEPLSGSAIHVPQSSVWSYRHMTGYESGYINFWELPELSGVGLITRIAVRAPAGIHVFVKRIAYEICTPCAEVCNDGIDNDCDGATDCADTNCAAACQSVSYYCDNDSDGYKDASVDGTCTGTGCQPAGCQVTPGNDCNDTDNAIHPGAAELCDGKNNDCNGSTADGSGESWYGTACDGPDTDLCNEGTYSCASGVQSCSDNTGSTVDLCDGQNNDCNPATADGSGESWYGTACDGPDTDLCNEGTHGCTGGAQSCSDSTGNTVEVCNDTLDNDCDGATDCADSDCPTPVVKSTNAQGSNKDSYTTNDAVYITGSHLPANTNVNIYIVGNRTWTNGMAIPSDVSSDGRNTLQTTGTGSLGPANVWPPPLTIGEYDIVLDVNQNGVYNACIDAVDDPNHPGFTVSSPTTCTDSDGDGFYVEPACPGPRDCDDNNFLVFPAATEVCNDSTDNDCDSFIDCDDPECVCIPCAVGGIIFPINKFMMLSP